MPSPIDKSSEMVNAALKIVEEGKRKGIILRMTGGTAVKFHCPNSERLFRGMKRVIVDVDLMSYGKFNRAMRGFFQEIGYTSSLSKLVALAGRQRHIYHDEENDITVDVLFDKFVMCHTIDFKGRLELDYPTVPLADMLLQKMQVVKINEKDINDVIVLLREHEVGETEKETINAKYIAKLLSNDWGFWYTVTTNLNLVKDFLGKYKVLSKEDRSDVETKIDKLLKYIEKEKKSLGWKLRVRVGTSRKWYSEVEEVPV